MSLTSEQRAAMAILVVFLTFGCILSVTCISCFIRYYWGNFKKTQLASFHLLLMSAFLCINTVTVYIGYFTHDGITHSWCQYHGITTMVGGGGAVFGHVLLAFERYYVVIKETPIPSTFIVLCLFVEVAYITSSLSMQFMQSRQGFVPMESGIWCFYNWTETYRGDKTVCIFVITMALLQSALINHAYFSVYMKTHNVATLLKRRKTSQSSSHSHMLMVEKRVFYRCITLTGTFVAFYMPHFISWFYREITGLPIAPWLDALILLWSGVDYIMTPLLVFYMMADFKEAVLAYMPRQVNNYFKRLAEKGSTAEDTITSITSKTSKPGIQSNEKVV